MDTYQPPVVTVDTVVCTAAAGTLAVLHVRRAAAPYRGRWALPGVYMAAGETIESASDRCLAVKAGVVLPAGAVRRTVTVYDSAGRDPRGPSLSIVHLVLVADEVATSGRWGAPGVQPGLAFDHDDIVATATGWLASHLWSDPTVFDGFLDPGEVTTMSDVLRVAGAVEGRGDPSNVRRKALASGMFAVASGQERVRRQGPGRPALGLIFLPRT